MTDTTFLPPESLRRAHRADRGCAPLAWPCGAADAPFLRGVVHDPTARRMDGVAGHAGLFSTAADLSRFCRMLLGGGRLGGARVLSPATIARMTSPSTPPEMRAVRGLGWDIDSLVLRPIAASCFRSDRSDTPASPARRSGSIRRSKSYVIFLSNRVHPDGKGDVDAAARAGGHGRRGGAADRRADVARRRRTREASAGALRRAGDRARRRPSRRTRQC